ncbi:MAG TPA: hypothetical protein VFA70_07350 [Dehalococcoidia bacterium]|jgi:hypothetical protein|nr:hypothetical protein [Dehalococcoidia bacterium]
MPGIEPARALAAFQSGAPRSLAALLAPDVVWHLQGCDGSAITVQGREAVLDSLGQRVRARAHSAAAAAGAEHLRGFRLERGLLAECWQWRWSLQEPAERQEAGFDRPFDPPRHAVLPSARTRRPRPGRADRGHAATRRAKQQRARGLTATLGTVRVVPRARLAP